VERRYPYHPGHVKVEEGGEKGESKGSGTFGKKSKNNHLKTGFCKKKGTDEWSLSEELCKKRGGQIRGHKP